MFFPESRKSSHGSRLGTSMGSNAAKRLAAMLRHNHGLKQLYLRRICLKDNEVDDLARALYLNTSLIFLDLQGGSVFFFFLY